MPSSNPEVRKRASQRYYSSEHGKAMRRASAARRKADPVRYAHRKRVMQDAINVQRRMNLYQAIEYLGGVCKDCGYKTDLRALEFDHVPEPRRGGYAIGHYLTYTWVKLKEQLDKCELVCANCHAIRTATRRTAGAPIP